MSSVNLDSNVQSTHSFPTPSSTDSTPAARYETSENTQLTSGVPDTQQPLGTDQQRNDFQGQSTSNSCEIVSSKNQAEAVWQCSHSLLSEGMKTTIPQPTGLLGAHISVGV